MNTPLIGVIGANGAVGKAVVALLHELSAAGALRLGIRRVSQTADQGVGAGIQVLDIDDTAALSHFCHGCRVVVNCSGPSYRILDRVALVAMEQGADYVDPCGDERLRSRLSSLDTGSAIISAGMLPGLSGILPRWLAHGFERCDRLTGYICVRDRFTRAGAIDYLAGLQRHESLAVWENGARLASGASRQIDVDLPFFSSPVTLHPYLDGEGERLAQALRLSSARFNSVFDGDRVLAAVSQFMAKPFSTSALEQAACKLECAAELDLAGRRPCVTWLYQLDGSSEARVRSRSLLLKADQATALTATIVDISVRALLAGDIPNGCHFAAEVLSPDSVVERLRKTPAVTAWTPLDEPIEAFATIEEGVL